MTHYKADASTTVSPKVQASGAGASVSMLVCFLLGKFVPFLADLPSEVNVALFGLVVAGTTWASGYATKDVAREAANHLPYGLGDYLTEDKLDGVIEDVVGRVLDSQNPGSDDAPASIPVN